VAIFNVEADYDDVSSQLAFGSFLHMSNGIAGGAGSPSSSNSGPSGQNERDHHTQQAQGTDPDLGARRSERIFGRLCYAPLYAQISGVMILGIPAIGFVWGGLGLLLYGNRHGVRALGDWRRPRGVGVGLLSTGVLLWLACYAVAWGLGDCRPIGTGYA
jgi:hypothetical protein